MTRTQPETVLEYSVTLPGKPRMKLIKRTHDESSQGCTRFGVVDFIVYKNDEVIATVKTESVAYDILRRHFEDDRLLFAADNAQIGHIEIL